MNAHSMIEVESAMETAAQEIAGNVVNLEPETELERHARIHRGIIEQQEKIAAQTLSLRKEVAAKLKADRNLLKERYAADLAAIAAKEAHNKSASLSIIQTAECLIEISKAAVARLEAAIEVA